MTALYNAVLSSSPLYKMESEKLVNRDIKNYHPHIDLDRKSLRQFTLSPLSYLHKWSITTECNINSNDNTYKYIQETYIQCMGHVSK